MAAPLPNTAAMMLAISYVIGLCSTFISQG